MAFSTWGTSLVERMRINGSGNVGIGTTGPGEKLEVYGNIKLSNAAIPYGVRALTPTNWGYSSTYRVIQVGAVSGNETVSIGYDPSGNASGVFTGDGREVLFRNGVQFVTPNAGNNNFNLTNLVLKDGNVGIGTASPGTKLEVAGETKATKFYSTDYSSYLVPGSISGSYWTEGSGNVYRASGNVGIGTASPANKLTVYGTGDQRIMVSNDGTSSAVFEARSGTYSSYIFTNAAGDLRMYPNAQSGITILGTGGNVGIGTAAPGSLLHLYASRPFQKIEAFGDHAQLQLIAASNTGGGSPSIDLFRGAANYYGKLFVERGTGGGNQPIFTGGAANDLILGSTALVPLKLGVNSDVKLTINTSGNIGIGTTNPQVPLHVVRYAGSSGTLRLEGNDNVVGMPSISFNNNNGGASATLNWDGGKFNLSTGAYINGNVGIGTTAPAALLEIKGGAADSASLILRNNNNNYWDIWNDNGGSSLNIQYGGTTKMVVQPGGNVGVGATGALLIMKNSSGSCFSLQAPVSAGPAAWVAATCP